MVCLRPGPMGATLCLWLVFVAGFAAPARGASRGYLVTPAELREIAALARAGETPHVLHVTAVLGVARQPWDFPLRRHETCDGAEDPLWNDNGGGTPVLVAKAMAYHLTGDPAYAREVRTILQAIMAGVETISLDAQQCRLNFAWGTPELVIAADLIEDAWKDEICHGPATLAYGDASFRSGPCKLLFQNWLVKNPYYVVSYAGRHSASNWGAAATNAMAHVADYLADRPEARLVHRNPRQENGGLDAALSPAAAWQAANRLALDRMNGYRVEWGSRYSCSLFDSSSQDPRWAPVKSQITENGVIPEDARREQFCNVPRYDGRYQNYPQLHIAHNVQQCELMRRRGDRSCFDNVDTSDLPNYSFVDRSGVRRTTHLRPGRGSLERAIRAVIEDANTEWRRTSALTVAYRYYAARSGAGSVERWKPFLAGGAADCSQDVCFGALTHSLPAGLVAVPPPAPPDADPPDLGRPGQPYLLP